MLNRAGVTAVVMGGACVALGIAFVQVRSQNRASQDAMAAEMREMRESMQALQSQMGQARLVGSVQRASGDGEANAPSGDNPGDSATPTEASEALAVHGEGGTTKSFAEALQASEDQFREEAIDAAWAGPTTNQVNGTLAKLMPAGSTIRGLSCHSTRCRLEMNLRDEASLDQFQRAALYGSEVLWRGQMMIDRRAEADGSIAMVAHLVRETAH